MLVIVRCVTMMLCVCPANALCVPSRCFVCGLLMLCVCPADGLLGQLPGGPPHTGSLFPCHRQLVLCWRHPPGDLPGHQDNGCTLQGSGQCLGSHAAVWNIGICVPLSNMAISFLLLFYLLIMFWGILVGLFFVLSLVGGGNFISIYGKKVLNYMCLA